MMSRTPCLAVTVFLALVIAGASSAEDGPDYSEAGFYVLPQIGGAFFRSDVHVEFQDDFDERVIGGKYVYLVDNQGRVIVTADPDVDLFSDYPDLVVQPGLLDDFSRQGAVGSITYEDTTGELVMAGFADMGEFGVNAAMD